MSKPEPDVAMQNHPIADSINLKEISGDPLTHETSRTLGGPRNGIYGESHCLVGLEVRTVRGLGFLKGDTAFDLVHVRLLFVPLKQDGHDRGSLGQRRGPAGALFVSRGPGDVKGQNDGTERRNRLLPTLKSNETLGATDNGQDPPSVSPASVTLFDVLTPSKPKPQLCRRWSGSTPEWRLLLFPQSTPPRTAHTPTQERSPT